MEIRYRKFFKRITLCKIKNKIEFNIKKILPRKNNFCNFLRIIYNEYIMFYK